MRVLHGRGAANLRGNGASTALSGRSRRRRRRWRWPRRAHGWLHQSCGARCSMPAIAGRPEGLHYMMVTRLLLAVVFIPMIIEARVAALNERAQLARGGVEA